MAITPSVLIACKGFLTGDGLTINKTMIGILDKTSALPLVSYAVKLPNSSLPPFIGRAQYTIDLIMVRAKAILPTGTSSDPAAGVKSFVSLFGTASAFSTMSSQFSSAIADFKPKGFKDLGIGAESFKSIESNNINGLFPPKLGARGTAADIRAALKTIGRDLGNLGSVYNFKDPATLGPKNLVQSLQSQGLADKNGINDAIYAYNYDAKDLSNIPDNILITILSSVQGNDLQQIIKLTGVKPVKNLSSAADLLDPHNIVPADSLKLMEITDTGTTGLAQFGNKFNNLNTPVDISKLSSLLGSMETKDLPRLDAVSVPLPNDVITAIKPQLGYGKGLYGQATITDIMGTVSGETHIGAFKNIYDKIVQVQNTPAGQNLLNSMISLYSAKQTVQDAQQNLQDAQQAPIPDPVAIAAAEAALASAQAAVSAGEIAYQNAIDTLISQPWFASPAASANNSLQESLNQLETERKNLSLAGRTNFNPVTTGTSVTSLLGFTTKLHTFGVDKHEVGYARLLENCANNNLSGDALLSSLMEGRNLARTSFLGKNISAATDRTGTDTATAQASIDKLKQNLSDARLLAKDGSPEYTLLAQQAQSKLDAVTRMANNNPFA